MATVPVDPPIFHITHLNNLPSILQHGGLWCDAQRIAKGFPSTNIGYLHIKQRRLGRVVETTAGGMLGDYVPFNFCSRSVMLCAIWKGHSDYSGGEDSILHLVSSVNRAVALGRDWAFSDRHAELGHALHYDNLAKLDEVQWGVMDVEWWSAVKEERQAEFLVRDFFPWTAVAEIGVKSAAIAASVQQLLQGQEHQPNVVVRSGWYYTGV